MQVTLPEMGESVTEGTVAKWLKQPGDSIREGEALVEVTTDKVDAEVPAPASGRLVKILANAGETITVGAALAEIEVGDGAAAAAAPAKDAPAASKPEAAPVAAPAAPKAQTPVAAAPSSPPPNGGAAPAVEVSEGAELLARARGIDIATVQGSGPRGAIRRRDVMDAIERKERASPSPAGSATAKESEVPVAAPEKAATTSETPAPAQSATGSIPLRGPAAALVKYMEES